MWADVVVSPGGSTGAGPADAWLGTAITAAATAAASSGRSVVMDLVVRRMMVMTCSFGLVPVESCSAGAASAVTRSDSQPVGTTSA
jgi:hypothetical protein